jgi:hypothetical protein
MQLSKEFSIFAVLPKITRERRQEQLGAIDAARPIARTLLPFDLRFAPVKTRGPFISYRMAVLLGIPDRHLLLIIFKKPPLNYFGFIFG